VNRTGVARWKAAGAISTAALLLAACHETAVVRSGPPEERRVMRTYPVSLQVLRADVLDGFPSRRSTLPVPFNQMTVRALAPPAFQPDWIGGFVDPGGFLADYKHLSASERSGDLLIEDAIGELYWPSEYATDDGPVWFRCGLVLHLHAPTAESTDVEVYEVVPTVWVGEHWAMSAHGIGFGRYHDIRFVEPTVKDRIDALDIVDRLLRT
jgi:hypothetical protein